MQQLIVLEDLKLEDVFSRGGSETLLKAIEEKATAFNPDTTTQAGRDKIKKMAADVGRCKKIIDDAGKGHKDQYLKLIQPIDSERKVIRDTLDKLKVEVRKPLTEYEEKKEREKEEKRKAQEAAELKKREEEEAEAKRKQDEIDAENARIREEQEAKQ
jgi:vacuolar-type H+-ATPase subunit I/STV1